MCLTRTPRALRARGERCGESGTLRPCAVGTELSGPVHCAAELSGPVQCGTELSGPAHCAAELSGPAPVQRAPPLGAMAGAAVLRVRRKRGGPEPAEALLLACKRRRAEPVETNLFKLVTTVSSKVAGQAGRRGWAGRCCWRGLESSGCLWLLSRLFHVDAVLRRAARPGSAVLSRCPRHGGSSCCDSRGRAGMRAAVSPGTRRAQHSLFYTCSSLGNYTAGNK